MRRISICFRRLRRVTPFVGPLLVIALLGTSLGVAQSNYCLDESRRGSKRISEACSDPSGLLEFAEAPAQPRYPDANASMVSVQQLRHVVPKKAQDEAVKGHEAFSRHRIQEAIGHLKTAVRIDPEFVVARNDLAVLDLRRDDPYPAIEQLNEAIKFDPHYPPLFINLAICYVATAHFDDAERAARIAAGLDPTRALTRYLIAASLYFQKKYTEEALKYATQTSDEHPAAHLYAAHIYILRKNFELAKNEIHAYLSGDRVDPEFQATANGWLDFMASQEQKSTE
jgi:tetratricopeptide (TPR) repeat protein